MISSIKQAAVPDQQKLLDYVNATAVVSKWSIAVTSLVLPALANPPPGYADFAAALVPPKVDALSWSMSIAPQFGAVAATLAALNPVMTDSFDAVKKALATLTRQPGDATAKAAAEKGLSLLCRSGSSAAAAVTQLVKLISTLRGHLASDAATLKGFAALAADAEGADAAKIAQCTAATAALQNMINNENEIMTLQKWATWDLNIFLAAAGICVSVMLIPAGAGAGVLIPGVIGLAGATVCSFLPIGQNEDFTDQMQQQQKDILSINVAIGDLNSQIALLQTAAGQIASLTDGTSAVATSLTTAANFWFNLQTFLTDMDTALASVSSSVRSGNIASASSSLIEAESAWTGAVQFTDLIKDIKYNVTAGVQTMPLPKGATIGT